MKIKNLFNFIVVDKKSLLVVEFSENILEWMPHLEIGERVLKYFNRIDYTQPSQRLVINEKEYVCTIIDTKYYSSNECEDVYLLNVCEDVSVSTEKNITSYESEYLDDYLDEYDVYDAYNERINVYFNGLVKLINNAENVVIMGHRYPDLDSFASSLGIYWLVKFIDKQKQCNIALDESTSSISMLYDKVMLEEDYKYAILFEEDCVKAVSDDTLLIVVDVDNTDIVAAPKVFEKCKTIAVMDHHRKSSNNIDAVLKLHLSYASSTSELVVKLLKSVCQASDMNAFLAEALLAGITIDTKNFAFQTTYETFNTAAFLKQVGVNSKRVRQLLQGKLVDYRTKAKIVNSVNIYNENTAISVVNLKIESNPKLIISMVADELLNLAGVEVAFVIAQVDKSVFVSARSLGMNVARIMTSLGGGGHLTVAATVVQDAQANDIKKEILKMIRN